MENNITQVVALGTSIGVFQAFGLITYKCSAEQAKALEEVWESGGYKLLGLTWEKYCLVYACLLPSARRGHHPQPQRVRRHLPPALRHHRRLPRNLPPNPAQDPRRLPRNLGALLLPILPEKPPASARPSTASAPTSANPRRMSDCARAATPSPLPKSPACKPVSMPGSTTSAALAARQKDDPLLGLVQYSIQHLQEIARSLPR